MAINVKHGVSAGPVAGAAFLAAQGRRRGAAPPPGGFGAGRRRKGDLTDEERRLQERAWAVEDRDARAAEAEKARAFSAEQAQLGRSFQAEQALAGREFQVSQAEAAQRRGREDLEYSLTTRQKMELAQLADAEAAALASSDFTDEEKAELRYRFAQRRAGVQPVARPKEPTPAELFSRRTYTDPKTGAVFPLDELGNPGNPIYQPPERRPTVQDRVKAWSEALKAATDAEGGVDEEKAKRYFSMMMAEPGGQAGTPGRPGAPQVDPDTGLEFYPEPTDDELRARIAAEPQATPGPAVDAPEQATEAPGLLKRIGLASLGIFGLGGGGEDQQAPEAPKTIDEELAAVQGGEPQRGAIEPGEINDLATVQYQLQVAREQARRVLEATSDEPSGGADTEWARARRKALGDGKNRGARGGGRESGDEARRKVVRDHANDRVKALEAREQQLKMQAARLSMRKALREQ